MTRKPQDKPNDTEDAVNADGSLLPQTAANKEGAASEGIVAPTPAINDNKKLLDFRFPHKNVTIKARNYEEAVKLLPKDKKEEVNDDNS